MDKPSLQQVHLSIAQCLADSDAVEARLLECVYHFNVALEQITDIQLLDQIGRLNLLATGVAKNNGDFHLALGYIILAMKLLLPQQTDPQLRAEVFKERAECEHLCGQQSTASSYYQQALQASTDERQRTRIYELLIKFHTDYGEFQQAFETGRKALCYLDFRVPAGFNPVNFAADYLHLKRKLRGSTIETLLALPEASDARIRDQILLLSAMQKAAYQIRPELCVALAAKQVRLCLRYGNTREAVVGYMVFGVIFWVASVVLLCWGVSMVVCRWLCWNVTTTRCRVLKCRLCMVTLHIPGCIRPVILNVTGSVLLNKDLK